MRHIKREKNNKERNEKRKKYTDFFGFIWQQDRTGTGYRWNPCKAPSIFFLILGKNSASMIVNYRNYVKSWQISTCAGDTYYILFVDDILLIELYIYNSTENENLTVENKILYLIFMESMRWIHSWMAIISNYINNFYGHNVTSLIE